MNAPRASTQLEHSSLFAFAACSITLESRQDTAPSSIVPHDMGGLWKLIWPISRGGALRVLWPMDHPFPDRKLSFAPADAWGSVTIHWSEIANISSAGVYREKRGPHN